MKYFKITKQKFYQKLFYLIYWQEKINMKIMNLIKQNIYNIIKVLLYINLEIY